jgi:hypothetical protein
MGGEGRNVRGCYIVQLPYPSWRLDDDELVVAHEIDVAEGTAAEDNTNNNSGVGVFVLCFGCSSVELD